MVWDVIGDRNLTVVIDLDYRGPGGQNYHHTLADTPDKVSAQSLQVMVDVAVALVRE